MNQDDMNLPELCEKYQEWINSLLDPTSEIRVYAENHFLCITAYEHDFSSQLICREQFHV